jgi:outer membrane receptor protein involved in Fe transport
MIRFASLPARARAWAIVLSLALTCGAAAAPRAGTTGKIQGRIVATDSGEPIAFADVLLTPADTTMRRVGGLTNADGTFMLEAPAGRYTLMIRALSYARKVVEGIVIEPDKLLPFSTALAPEAIQQEEIVVEGKMKQNSEASMLAARKKAAAVGDAVSAEQVQRSPDKDAAEVLRRVTGLSVADGKYVFVRGLGERYSSVEVDGVRVASPEENKRVVPLDLVPANLLENIVVQKTHTADRPGEFGGGDVQVRTKDFPGRRTWSVSMSLGMMQHVTFKDRQTYTGTRADMFGYGADFRKIPDEVIAIANGQKLARGNFDPLTRADAAQEFRPIWSTFSERTIPDATYAATYGDEFKVFGRPLGLVNSWSFSRRFDREDLSHRYFQSSMNDTVYDYAVTKDRETASLGGIAALSYRISPRHSLHLRGLYTHSADDEVRRYEGPDKYNFPDDGTGVPVLHRNVRLMYVERTILSGTLQGQHTLSQLLGSSLDWKLTRSEARRLQPDRREYTYNRYGYLDGNGEAVRYWRIASNGYREFGDLEDDGWGVTASGSVPYRLGSLGNGKVVLGYDRQTKDRVNEYRRFEFIRNTGSDPLAPADSLFGGGFDDTPNSTQLEETTLEIDNYLADQRVTAGYLSADVPFGRRLRGNFGIRVEDGYQDVRSYDLGQPASMVIEQAKLENTDWLPSANLTWAATEEINVRVGASRTVSRPDLNELSPSPSLEYVGGFRVAGNPDLVRARMDNYDVRFEYFPGLTEVLAAGVFYKKLYQPIERAITGASAPLLVPRNSADGRNMGIELEARAGLGRVWSALNDVSLNANASVISSQVHLEPGVSRLGTTEHPLQGQASHLLNVALSYAPSPRLELVALWSTTGERLKTLAYDPLPDIYEQPTSTIDVTLSVSPIPNSRLKLSGKNLLDPEFRQVQGGKEVAGYRNGRGFTIGFSYGL